HRGDRVPVVHLVDAVLPVPAEVRGEGQLQGEDLTLLAQRVQPHRDRGLGAFVGAGQVVGGGVEGVLRPDRRGVHRGGGGVLRGARLVLAGRGVLVRGGSGGRGGRRPAVELRRGFPAARGQAGEGRSGEGEGGEGASDSLDVPLLARRSRS